MAEKKTGFDLEVSARTGHGRDFFTVFEPAKALVKNKKGEDVPALALNASLDEARELCITYIKEHRSGGEAMDYRIRDRVSGEILS